MVIQAMVQQFYRCIYYKFDEISTVGMTDQAKCPDAMDKSDGMALAHGEAVSGAETHNGMASEVKVATEESMRCRVLKTIALYMSFAGIGFAAPILGLSIVHMEHLLDTNTQTIAYTFTCHSIGYTVGGIICGIIYDRSNKEFVFSASILAVGFITIASGFVGSIYAFMAVMLLQGVSMGFIDAAGQSYCVNLWHNHRFKDPVYQASHACWSLAGTIAPFVTRNFLIELSSSNSQENSLNTTMGDMNEPRMENDTFSSAAPNTTGLSEEQLAGIQMTRFAYLTIGCMILCTSILFLVIYFCECSPIVIPRRPKDGSNGKSTRGKSQKQQGKWLMILFLFMLFMFCFLYIYIEGLPLAYFTAFAIKHLDWSVHYATLLMALFYAMHCAGRVIGVPLSIVLKPLTMVTMNLTITAVAYILLLFVNIHDGVMWLSAVLAGFGMSSTFAAMILWVSETVQITGRVASVFLVGGSVGGMTAPLLVGQLFDRVSPMWMVYVLVAASLLHIAMFLTIFFFVRKWKAKLLDHFDDHQVVHLNANTAVEEEKLNTEQS